MRQLTQGITGAMALAAVTLTACGDDGSRAAAAGRSNAATADERGFERAQLQHAACMRRNGIDLPDPKPGGGPVLVGPQAGGSPEAFRVAEKKCSRHLRRLAPPRLPEAQKTEMRDAALEHARCMREQGIDFPDPAFDKSGAITMPVTPATSPGNPRVRTAQKKCSRHLPRPDGASGAVGDVVPSR